MRSALNDIEVTQWSNVGHVQGINFERTRTNFPRKISKEYIRNRRLAK